MPIIVEPPRSRRLTRWWRIALYLTGIGGIIALLASLPYAGLIRDLLSMSLLTTAGTETTLSALPQQPSVRIYYRHTSLIDEPERYLSVTTSEGTIRVRLMSGWGPRMRAGLYSAGDNQLAILDAAGGGAFVSLRPLQFVRNEALRLPSQLWSYLGAFDHYSERRSREAGESREVSRFIPAAEQSECIPAYFDVPKTGPRVQFMRRTCPEFEPVAAGSSHSRATGPGQ